LHSTLLQGFIQAFAKAFHAYCPSGDPTNLTRNTSAAAAAISLSPSKFKDFED
jgi:hypothetical protein